MYLEVPLSFSLMVKVDLPDEQGQLISRKILIVLVEAEVLRL
jgi:hypothetical protein